MSYRIEKQEMEDVVARAVAMVTLTRHSVGSNPRTSARSGDKMVSFTTEGTWLVVLP